ALDPQPCAVRFFLRDQLCGELNLEVAKLTEWKVELVGVRIQPVELSALPIVVDDGASRYDGRRLHGTPDAVASLDKIFRDQKAIRRAHPGGARPHVRWSRQQLRFCFGRTIGLQIELGEIGMLLRIEHRAAFDGGNEQVGHLAISRLPENFGQQKRASGVSWRARPKLRKNANRQRVLALQRKTAPNLIPGLLNKVRIHKVVVQHSCKIFIALQIEEKPDSRFACKVVATAGVPFDQKFLHEISPRPEFFRKFPSQDIEFWRERGSSRGDSLEAAELLFAKGGWNVGQEEKTSAGAKALLRSRRAKLHVADDLVPICSGISGRGKGVARAEKRLLGGGPVLIAKLNGQFAKLRRCDLPVGRSAAGFAFQKGIGIPLTPKGGIKLGHRNYELERGGKQRILLELGESFAMTSGPAQRLHVLEQKRLRQGAPPAQTIKSRERAIIFPLFVQNPRKPHAPQPNHSPPNHRKVLAKEPYKKRYAM